MYYATSNNDRGVELKRGPNTTGIKLFSPYSRTINRGEKTGLVLNFKLKIMRGYFAMFSPSYSYGLAGLTILNSIHTKNRDGFVTLHVTSILKKEFRLRKNDFFAVMHIMEEGDRSVPLRISLDQWEQDKKPLNLEITNNGFGLIEIDGSDSDGQEKDETSDKEENEIGMRRKKIAKVTYSSDEGAAGASGNAAGAAGGTVAICADDA